MADGALTVNLDAYASEKLAARAKAMGLPPEELASLLLSSQLFDYDDFTWINGDPRDESASNYDLNETGRAWKDVRPEFVALIEKTFGRSE